MNYNNLFKFAFAFVLLVSTPLVFAASQVSISPRGLSACACDPVYYNVEIYSDHNDVFEVSFESQHSFSAFIPPQIPVPERSSIRTTLVLNTACDAQQGNYSFFVTARGGLSASKAGGFVVVRSCRNLELSLPPQQSVCAGSFQSVLVSLKNAGIASEKGKLVFENLPRSFYSLANDFFELSPGQTANFLLSIQPPAGTPPSSFTYNVRANNAFATAALEIRSCRFEERERISMSASAKSVEVCAGSTRSLGVVLKNEGASASFDLTSSGVPGSFSQNRVSISKGVSKNVDYTLNARDLQPGNHTLVLNAFGPSSSATERVNVVVKDCLQAVFGDLELCLGDSGSIPFAFKNKNPFPREYVFTTSAQIPSRVEPKSVLLNANEAVSATLFVSGSALGSYNVVVFANSTVLKTPRVVVKACAAVPQPLAPLNKTFEGELGVEQEFALEFNAPLQNASITLPQRLFSVSSIRVEKSRLLFKAKPLGEGLHSVQASIQANGRLFQENLSFSITQPSVEARVKTQTTLSVSDSNVVENEILLEVSNKGNSTVTLSPSMTAVENAVFEPSVLKLGAGEEKELKAVFKAPANSSVSLKLSSSENARDYVVQTTAVQTPPSTTTGFFTVTRVVGIFAVLVVLAIILLAFVLKKEFEEKQTEENAKKGKKGK